MDFFKMPNYFESSEYKESVKFTNLFYYRLFKNVDKIYLGELELVNMRQLKIIDKETKEFVKFIIRGQNSEGKWFTIDPNNITSITFKEEVLDPNKELLEVGAFEF